MKHITINQKRTSIFINYLTTKVLLTIVALLFLSNSHIAQSLNSPDLFVIAQNTLNEVNLFKYNTTNLAWDNVGKTNRTNIESISIHPINSTIYAVNGGELGTLNIYDGSFNSIGYIGSAYGELGQITINNVYGIACSYVEEAIYVTHRITDSTQDLLIKIDNKTGSLISNSFKDSNNNDVDYAIIEKAVFSQDFIGGEVADIAILPNTNELYVLHTTDNESGFQSKSLFAINNIQNGMLEEVKNSFSESAEGFCLNLNETIDQLFITTKEKHEILGTDIISWDVDYDDSYVSPITGFNIKDIDFAKSLCVQNLTIAENFTTGSPIYPLQKSSNLITTETTASSNVDVQIEEGDVEFKSNHITLNAGFEVTTDANFDAIIAPCQ